MGNGRLSRRDLLAATASAGSALAIGGSARVFARGRPRATRRIDFSVLGDRQTGWGMGWRSVGVANLRRTGGEGILEAGSDVFPNDPRPVAFLRDTRFRDGEIAAEISRVGTAPGVVIRRRGPRDYYAAIYDQARLALRIVRRHGAGLDEIARVPVVLARSPIVIAFRAQGASPTELQAELRDADGRRYSASGTDASARLQGAGDAGVLATAETLFPSDPNPVLPALGNLHLLPWAVQEGQAFMATAIGEQVIAEIRRRSTAGFRSITVTASRRPRRSRPAVLAATTGAPVTGGAWLHVATDLPADVELELSRSPRFRSFRSIDAGPTDRFGAVAKRIGNLGRGARVFWRARLHRGGETAIGPVRSFRVLPDGGGHARLAIASCASQFGPTFELLADRDPDVFIWQGDLNYPDTHGPLAQTMSGYAGIWRDFLANPVLEPVLARSAFAAQRDDHDYAVQDANSANVEAYPWGLEPWRALVNRHLFYSFRAGAAEIWVLDQRRHKTDPATPDSRSKTLLGRRQRRWLERTLAGSSAPFKVICSPATVFMPYNARDGNWASGYQTERDELLAHIRRNVSGTTLFVTGDTHFTGVYDRDGHFEARAAPMGIPKPNDITITDPLAAQTLRTRPGIAYAGDQCHFAMVEVDGRGRGATLELSLVRDDGEVPYRRGFAAGGR